MRALGTSCGGPCYISSMFRPFASRLAAALIAVLAGFAAPAAALAHGADHGREHQREHYASAHTETPGRALASDWHGIDRHRADSTVSGLGGDADHPHPQLDCAPRVRPDIPTFVLPAPVVVPPTPVLDVQTDAPVAYEALPRADPSGGPPPRLRAPPLR